MNNFRYKEFVFQDGTFGHPQKKGVYALFLANYETKESELIYIGSSKNLSKRINNPNHLYRIGINICPDNYIIYTMSCTTDNYIEVEKEMIKYFNPHLNIQHNG